MNDENAFHFNIQVASLLQNFFIQEKLEKSVRYYVY